MQEKQGTDLKLFFLSDFIVKFDVWNWITSV